MLNTTNRCQNNFQAPRNTAFAFASATAGTATATAGAPAQQQHHHRCNNDQVQLSNPSERGGNCPVNFGSWGDTQSQGTGQSSGNSLTPEKTRDLLAMALALLLKGQSEKQNQAPPQQGDDQQKVAQAGKADKKKKAKKS